MATNDPDRSVHQHIEQLIHEEHRLHEQPARTDSDRRRLDEIKVELDQYWDLLRQRRALREFKDDPDDAQIRPADVVENYEG